MMDDPRFMTEFFYPVMAAFGSALVAVFGAIAVYAARKVGQWTNEQSFEAAYREVEDAIRNGIAYEQSHVASSDMARSDIQGRIINGAYVYVLGHVSQATLGKAGIDVMSPHGQTILTQKITSRLAPAAMMAAATGTMTVAAAATAVISTRKP